MLRMPSSSDVRRSLTYKQTVAIALIDVQKLVRIEHGQTEISKGRKLHVLHPFRRQPHRLLNQEALAELQFGDIGAPGKDSAIDQPTL